MDIAISNEQTPAPVPEPAPEPARLEYRMTRLDTTQVSAHWPALAAAIQASTPDGIDASAFVGPNVFQALASGQMQAWAVEAMRETPEIVLWALTRWQTDGMTGCRHLSIFSLHAYETVPDSVMQEAFVTLLKFAQGGGAHLMSALTSNPRLIGLAHQFGADTLQRFVYWKTDGLGGTS